MYRELKKEPDVGRFFASILAIFGAKLSDCIELRLESAFTGADFMRNGYILKGNVAVTLESIRNRAACSAA